MNLLHGRRALYVLCASLLAASGHGLCANADTPDPGFTPKATLDSLFEVEGNAPFSKPYDGSLAFSALDSKFSTANGHGYRNELKIAKEHRRTIEQTREHFSAVVTPTLPDGAKTIVAQYHVDGLDTILKVYVQDSADSHALDGKAGNGVFDIVARILGSDGKEVETALGTIRSGDSFTLDVRFENGIAAVGAATPAAGLRQTEPTRIKGDQRDIYFKFGDYAQALDPDTHRFTSDPAKWDAWFRQNHIDHDQVRFSHTRFVRE
jgi:hypothetical protein